MTREVMKQALEALEWNLPVIEDYGDKEQLNRQHKAITALRQALEQTDEPVAWNTGVPPMFPQQKEGETFIASYEQQPADEPVVFNTLSSLRHKKTVGPIESAMTGRPQTAAQWQGLTDEEIKALASWWPSYDQIPALMVLAKDIENSLKGKNT